MCNSLNNHVSHTYFSRNKDPHGNRKRGGSAFLSRVLVVAGLQDPCVKTGFSLHLHDSPPSAPTWIESALIWVQFLCHGDPPSPQVCGWLTHSWFHSSRWWLVVSLPNHFGRALTESDTKDALRRTGGEACCYWASAFNWIALLRLLLVGYLPSECSSVHLETVHERLRRLGSQLHSLFLPLFSITFFFPSLLAPVCLIFFRTWTGPPLCLYPPLIFPHFFFSVSLPIFMPVPLCQYTFRHTLAPVFHPFFLSLSLFGAFQLYQAFCLSVWWNNSGSSLCAADSHFVSLSAFVMCS